MSHDDAENYCFNGRDRALVASAVSLLRKIVAAKSLLPAEMVSVAKLLHVFSRLPAAPNTGMNVTISVVSPRRQFGDIETYHWWEVGIEDQQLSIGSGGHFYQPSTGGDTFTTMSWIASPGYETDFADYRDDLAIVPDVRSFPDAVGHLDLAEIAYKFEINDPDNEWLEEESSDDMEPAHGEAALDEESANAATSWSLSRCDTDEQKLTAIVKPEVMESNEVQYAYGVEHCDACGGSLNERAVFVDGRLKDDIMWANMCAQCFLVKGAGIGWGLGQLYARQPNGDWRLVAGFQPPEDSDEP